MKIALVAHWDWTLYNFRMPLANVLREHGCDVVLHCNGKLEEMREVAAEAPILAGRALQRAEAAVAARKRPDAGVDRKAARAELDELVRRAGEMSA